MNQLNPTKDFDQAMRFDKSGICVMVVCRENSNPFILLVNNYNGDSSVHEFKHIGSSNIIFVEVMASIFIKNYYTRLTNEIKDEVFTLHCLTLTDKNSHYASHFLHHNL